MPLPETTIDGIHVLLREGISQRKIAERLGVSRGNVCAVANGSGLPICKSTFVRPDTRRPPEICPQCGKKVYMPCLACQIRRLHEGENKRPIIVLPPGVTLGIDLKSPEKERYEEVKNRRNTIR